MQGMGRGTGCYLKASLVLAFGVYSVGTSLLLRVLSPSPGPYSSVSEAFCGLSRPGTPICSEPRALGRDKRCHRPPVPSRSCETKTFGDRAF